MTVNRIFYMQLLLIQVEFIVIEKKREITKSKNERFVIKRVFVCAICDPEVMKRISVALNPGGRMI